MKKRDITTAQGRAKLPVRRAPYTEIMGKGQALLLYIGKLGSNWGARTALGDRVIAPEGIWPVETKARVKEYYDVNKTLINAVWEIIETQDRASGNKPGCVIS